MRRNFSLFVVLILGLASSGRAEPKIEALQMIPLQEGINPVAHFASDGADARIAKAWRGNGDAHGYWIYLTMLPGHEEYRGAGWDLATIETGKGSPEEIVYELPFNGEQYKRSVRFATGRVDGRTAGLLITAGRDMSQTETLVDAAPVDLDIYRLVAQEEVPGQTPYAFRKIVHRRSGTPYCNSDLALSQMLGLPLPKDYAGPNRVDGCIR